MNPISFLPSFLELTYIRHFSSIHSLDGLIQCPVFTIQMLTSQYIHPESYNDI